MRKNLVLVSAATVLTLLTAGACSSSTSAKPAAGKASAAAKPSCGGTGAGTTAKAGDGKFSWVATKTEYLTSYTDHDGTVSQPSNPGWGFCLLTVTVKNLTADGVDYNFLRDKAFDASGTAFKMYGFIQEDGKVYSNAYFEAGKERQLTEIFEIKPGAKIATVSLGASGGSPIALK